MDPVSPELVALLAACRARPADDLPRLVLADWLDENGQPERAEFVRVQVELSHPTADAKRTAELRGRERELLAANVREWSGELYQAVGELVSSGEAEAIGAGPFKRWQKEGKSGVWNYPRGLMTFSSVRQFEQLGSSRVVSWLRSPFALWLEQVNLTVQRPDTFVKLDLPDELSGKIALTLKMDGLFQEQSLVEQLRGLAVSSNYSAVHSVEVTGAPAATVLNEISRTDVTKLIRLTVPSDATAATAANIVSSAPFTSLSSLDLGPLPEAGLRALIRSPYLGNLTELNLVGSQIGDAGMVALCGSKLAHTLRAVEFPNTGIGDAGAIALACSPLFAHMHGPRLNLMMNRIGDAGLKAIAESEYLLRFRELVLRENQVGDAGVIALAESPYSANLQYLDFWRNRVTDRGAFALARSPHLNAVVDLSLKENAVTEAGAAALHERFGEAVKVG